MLEINSSLPGETTRAGQLSFGPDHPWVAPLAGYTDLPFRLLCREQGAAVACTEMVSAKGLIYGLQQKKKDPSGTQYLLGTCADDSPLVVQLFGEEASFLGAAVQHLAGRGYDWFDLNMGCSVPKVNKTGAGSAMLKDIPNALAVAKAMIAEAKPGHVGFKLRLGWSAPDTVFVDLAKALEQLGAGWVSLHPRFARQGFSGQADWPQLARLVRAVGIPVIASGDLFTAADGVRCVQETGVASVMFARGAIMNPAVFGEYRRLLACVSQGRQPASKIAASDENYLGAEELLALIRRHAILAKDLTPGKPGKSGLAPALFKMRTVAPRYVRHLPGSRQLRTDLARCTSWEELDATLEAFFFSDSCPGGSGATHNDRPL